MSETIYCPAPKCSKAFWSACSYEYELHQIAHQSKNAENQFQCPLCEYTRPGRNSIKSHLVKHFESVYPFTCDYCDYESKYNSGLLQHFKVVHEPHLTKPKPKSRKPVKEDIPVGENQEKFIIPDSSSSYQCKCGQNFSAEVDFQIHSIHHQSSAHKIQCPQHNCNFENEDMELVRLHLVGAHYTLEAVKYFQINSKNFIKPEVEKVSVFICSKCGFSTTSRKTSQKHRIQHFNESESQSTEPEKEKALPVEIENKGRNEVKNENNGKVAEEQNTNALSSPKPSKQKDPKEIRIQGSTIRFRKPKRPFVKRKGREKKARKQTSSPTIGETRPTKPILEIIEMDPDREMGSDDEIYYVCLYRHCGVKFESNYEYRLHGLVAHNALGNTFNCTECNEVINISGDSDSVSLESHLREHYN